MGIQVILVGVSRILDPQPPENPCWIPPALNLVNFFPSFSILLWPNNSEQWQQNPPTSHHKIYYLGYNTLGTPQTMDSYNHYIYVKRFHSDKTPYQTPYHSTAPLGNPVSCHAKLQVGIEVWIHVEGEGIPFTWMKGREDVRRMSKHPGIWNRCLDVLESGL